MKILAVLAAALMLAACAVAEETIEMPRYSVIAEDGPAQIRTYPPMIVAEVSVAAGSAAEAANAGFRPLAGYIFGANSPRAKIAMTSPVMAAPEGERIAMTSPVTAAPAGGGGAYIVRFIMPEEWSMATLPAPSNPDVRLAELPARTVAALSYTGGDNAKRRTREEEKLRAFIDAAGYAATGQAEWAGYDSPMVPFWMRRYDVMIPVGAANKK